MDVYSKYAAAIVAVKNNLTSLEDITMEMLDSEINFSLNKAFFYTEDDPKQSKEGVFKFAPHSKITEIFKSTNKYITYLSPHTIISNKNKGTITDSKKIKNLFNGNCGELNFVLLNSQSYLSKNGVGGYKIPVFDNKLYFLSQITPYKPSFSFKGSDGHEKKHFLFVDLNFSLLMKYVELFIDHWESYNQDVFYSNVNEKNNTFYKPQTINYSTKIGMSENKKHVDRFDYPLMKFQILSFLNKIDVDAEFLNEKELSSKLKNVVIYDLSLDDKKATPYNLNEHLLTFAKDDKLSDFINYIFDSFYITYSNLKKDNPDGYDKKRSELVYYLLNILKSPENNDNIKNLNTFRLRYGSLTKDNKISLIKYNKFINIMEEIFKLNNREDLINEVKIFSKSIRNGIWKYAIEKEEKNPSSKKKHWDYYDEKLSEIQYSISGMGNLNSFLTLNINIRRRIGYHVNSEKLFDILLENPNLLDNMKSLIVFYISQSNIKKSE